MKTKKMKPEKVEMKTPAYTAKTVQKFLDHLAELGLSVYGQAMDKEGGYLHGCMDYNAEEIVKRRKLIVTHTLGECEQ